MARKGLVRRLLSLAWEHRVASLIAFVGQVASLALGLGVLNASGLAIDVVRGVLDPNAPVVRWPLGLEAPAAWSPGGALLAIGTVALALGLARAAVGYGTALAVGQLIHYDIVPALRARVFDKLLRLGPAFFQKHASGSIINRVTGDVQSVRAFVDGVLLQGGILLLTLVVYVVYMVRVNAGLALACLLPTPLIAIATVRFSRWARPAYETNRELADAVVLSLSEGIKGIRVTKTFGGEAHALAGFRAKNRAVRDQQEHIFRQVSRLGPTVSFVTALDLAVLLLYGGALVTGGTVTLGQLVVFAGLLQQFAVQIAGTATVLNTLEQSVIAARRVFEVLDAPVVVESPARPLLLPAAHGGAASAAGGIQFERVSFGYDGLAPVLHDVDLTVAPGRCVAITGATGAGKSTLLGLVARFYDPALGRVAVDGLDARDVELGELRRRVGVVFQESLLFRGSVRDNIAFGQPDAAPDAVERAARVAGAHAFIAELPAGYDTKLEEGGGNLSGGQRQRIAIARALLHDPPVLLLDDPTSSVDAETEDEVLSAIESARKGRTTLLVTHRFRALRAADHIVVLHAGRIIERGTHAELARAGGRYAQAAALELIES